MTLFIQNIWKLLWEMATHSRTLAWKIPWTEEPGGLQSMGSQRVGQGMWRRDMITWHSWVAKWDSKQKQWRGKWDQILKQFDKSYQNFLKDTYTLCLTTPLRIYTIEVISVSGQR